MFRFFQGVISAAEFLTFTNFRELRIIFCVPISKRITKGSTGARHMENPNDATMVQGKDVLHHISPVSTYLPSPSNCVFHLLNVRQTFFIQAITIESINLNGHNSVMNTAHILSFNRTLSKELAHGSRLRLDI